ncbi:MAG: hypothetical protein ABFS12_01130 [Bacteroidota bacterium]
MKNIIKILPFLILTFSLIGCIDVHYKMNLKPDGSGTIEETLYMNAAMVQMIKGFMAMADDSTKEEFSLLDEVELRNEAMEMGEGVRYVSGEKLEDNGREGYRALYEFDDVNKIKMDQDVSDKAPSMGEEAEETKEDDITFKFIKGNPATLTIIMPEDKEEPGLAEETEETEEYENEQDEEWNDEVKGIMKDFRILIQLEVEGDIVETNATYVDESTLTLVEMSFDKILENPEELKKLKALDDASYEESREILEDIPGVKFETNEKVTVVFD